MTSIHELESRLADGRFLSPTGGVAGFVDLARAMARLAGVTMPGAGSRAEAVLSRLGDPRRCVFVLVDGMGMRQLEEHLPVDAFLRRHLDLEMRAVFLSTTAAALTSLATCRWPAEHAVLAWWTYNERLGRGVLPLPFIEQGTQKPLPSLGIGPNDVFPEASVWGNATRRLVSLVPDGIRDSVYTQYSSGGTTRVGYRTLEEAFAGIATYAQTVDGTDFVYAYLPHLDEMAHEKGNRDPSIRRLMGMLNGQLEALAGQLPRGTRLVISADHGQADVPPDGLRWALEEVDPLAAMLACRPTGEPCIPFFHVRPGQETAFARAFLDRFGRWYVLVTPDQAEQLRLFGPVSLTDTARRRLGTYIGICLEPAKFYVKPLSASASHIGVHGGLSPAEMRIPLIVA